METLTFPVTSTIHDTPAADWEAEQQEWLASMAYVLKGHGPERSRELLNTLRDYVLRQGVRLTEESLNTPYVNTIPPEGEPTYPGDLGVESRIENILRWNAMAMVLRANDTVPGIGGHIATYASAATIYEVALHHFIRKRTDGYGGDLVFFQAHASPGIYARAVLEGRLTTEHMVNFRRELHPGGLPSYPHPRNMRGFWQAPSASMGLSTVSAIYQARFARYLENRGLKPKNGGKVWAFIGDGESDEPEVRGTLGIAAREKLDNLIVVVNCNLQRLDGPVRGSGKIIQELERVFTGAGWNVIKVVWASEWDALLARDHKGVLVDRMNRAVDGDYQLYTVLSGHEIREHWVDGDPELEAIMRPLTDEDIRTIRRGGHDPKKIYAAFEQAMNADGKPTVILAKTVKGYGIGSAAEGRNTAHQKKQLNQEERVACARRWNIPLGDEEAAKATFFVPEEDSPEVRYLRGRREALGGPFPQRDEQCPVLEAPDRTLFGEFIQGTGDRSVSTTMVLARMLLKLLKDENLGQYIVPIIPDEARTFGMDGLFSVAGIYAPQGQRYRPVDASNLAYYKESEDGQVLQEGICEAGAIASFMAAGTAYAVHGMPMVPFYTFYSIFGFPRVGDMIWACGDMLCKGFLIGATSGRTTLNGEGVQHQDGHSHVLANTYPNMKSYDPAFAYELAVIIRDGIHRMYEKQEAVFYYITVGNQNYPMPPMPEGSEEGIIKGLYRFRRSDIDDASAPRAHLFGSGAVMSEVLQAQGMLEALAISTDVWSGTSYNEVHREAREVERWNRLHPEEAHRQPYIHRLLREEDGVFVAASDYMKAWPGSIAPWVPGPYTVLGTDGYGLSETRSMLRDHFEVSAKYIVLAALHSLAEQGHVETAAVQRFTAEQNIDPDKRNPTP